MKAKIASSLSRWGYSHILKDRIELPALQALCQENGWIVTDTDACYTYTVMEANHKGGNTDWDAVRQEQFNRRQKTAQRKKKHDILT